MSKSNSIFYWLTWAKFEKHLFFCSKMSFLKVKMIALFETDGCQLHLIMTILCVIYFWCKYFHKTLNLLLNQFHVVDYVLYVCGLLLGILIWYYVQLNVSSSIINWNAHLTTPLVKSYVILSEYSYLKGCVQWWRRESNYKLHSKESFESCFLALSKASSPYVFGSS